MAQATFLAARRSAILEFGSKSMKRAMWIAAIVIGGSCWRAVLLTNIDRFSSVRRRVIQPALLLSLAATACMSAPMQGPNKRSNIANAGLKPAKYRCDTGAVVTVLYNDKDPVRRGVRLTMDGRDYDLGAASAVSGARYNTDHGIMPERLLEWRTMGDEAMLLDTPLDDSVKRQDATVRAHCKKA
jgi:membrane-bound inhibitor of C-type lysozyme